MRFTHLVQRGRRRRTQLLVGAAAGVALFAAACGGGAHDDVAAESTSAPPSQVAIESSEAAAPSARSGTPLEPSYVGNEGRIADVLRRSFPDLRPERRIINLEELLQGQIPDGIPAIDAPKFVSLESAADWLGDQEPVVALELNGEARAYPIQILIWHEIVNDTVGGVPVVVTFCPLCNTALSFERTVDGEIRDFGTSGLLRRSDLIMYDRQTQTLWQQITGEAIVGVDVPKRLSFLQSPLVSFASFRQSHPEGVVLSRNTGFVREYGRNPYSGYDEVGSRTLFPVDDFDDFRLDAKERVLTVEVGGEAVAFPFSALSELQTIESDVGGQPVVAFWQSGTLSPLDKSFIIGSANVGAASAYSPFVDGRRLTFEGRDGAIVDRETGSTWNVLGSAIDGPLAGTSLESVLSANHFWFAWVVFQPDTRVVTGTG